jgi:hypothetical protein
MVTPHIRRRADSGNVGRHTRRAVRAVGVTSKQPVSSSAVKGGGGRRRGRCTICPTAKDRKIDWKWCQCLEWVGKGQLCRDNSNSV